MRDNNRNLDFLIKKKEKTKLPVVNNNNTPAFARSYVILAQ